MGGACFSNRSVQIHPHTTGVVPGVPCKPASGSTSDGQGPSPAADIGVAAPGADDGSQVQSGQAASLEQVTATSQPLQAPEAPAGPSRPKPKKSLIKAVKDGDIAMIEELLSGGAALESLGMWDNTPLLAACMYGHSEAALRLMAKKANILAVNENGATPLHYASVEGSQGVVEALLSAARADGGDVDATKLINCGQARIYNRHLDAYAQRTPLTSAAESGFTELVSTLAAAGAAIDSADEDGRTALWLACRHSRIGVSKFLLQKGAEVNAKDTQGVSVLGAATVNCNEEMVLSLLTHGLKDVNDTSGSPLYSAVKAGKRSVVEALLTHGASVQPNAGVEATAMPLHAACEKGDEYLVSLLVRARADPSLGNASGLTAFDLLRRRGLADGAIVSLLRPPATAGQDGGTGEASCDVGEATG